MAESIGLKNRISENLIAVFVWGSHFFQLGSDRRVLLYKCSSCSSIQSLFFSSQCNNHEIRPGKHIGVCISVANNRLFVGSIPKSKTKEQIVEEFSKVTGELCLEMRAHSSVSVFS